MGHTVFKPIKDNLGDIKVLKIDLDDYLALSDRAFGVKTCNRGYSYCYQKRDSKSLRIHRLITGAKKSHVDHINHDTMDNRKSNLRLCTIQQNKCNSKKRADSKQRYKGVFKQKNRYRAVISKDGVRKQIGSFISEDEAAIAYNKRARELFGEFAYQNKIETREV